MLNKCSSY